MNEIDDVIKEMSRDLQETMDRSELLKRLIERMKKLKEQNGTEDDN